MYMAARDKKQPVVIDLEDDDSVALIPWDYVVDKMDHILGEHVIPDIGEINKDLIKIRDKLREWAEESD